jgi:hypothetical protein
MEGNDRWRKLSGSEDDNKETKTEEKVNKYKFKKNSFLDFKLLNKEAE